ncbi:Uncharacterised protein [Vibrio cholerae]|nr:Uncharacterised protein [Vibrio cholerae]CSD40578.1 Uncharacterised protein [Vibrio cholerae]CSI23406.1 Uncharacterised protein [Vibrio cholerae]CSI79557.1 Uncharacterised protein [Vibrio cholerae]
MNLLLILCNAMVNKRIASNRQGCRTRLDDVYECSSVTK